MDVVNTPATSSLSALVEVGSLVLVMSVGTALVMVAQHLIAEFRALRASEANTLVQDFVVALVTVCFHGPIRAHHRGMQRVRDFEEASSEGTAGGKAIVASEAGGVDPGARGQRVRQEGASQYGETRKTHGARAVRNYRCR